MHYTTEKYNVINKKISILQVRLTFYGFLEINI